MRFRKFDLVMKSYTDLQQSKKLAEILSLESADMYWDYDVQKHEYYPMVMDDQFDDTCIRAWSLAALLSSLPFPVLYMEMVAGMIFWCCECHFIETDEVVKIKHYDNSVDACVAMIEKLHELNLL